MAEVIDKSWAIGIDLGTANTRVAVFRNDMVEIIPDADGGLSMPSCVSFNDVGRLIGAPAMSQFAFNPVNTVFDVKRLVGRRFTDPEVQADVWHFPFKVTESRGQPVIEVEYMGEMRVLTIVEILSMILCRAKENAEAYLGSPVGAAVISIPPYFFTYERNTILDAATIAGLKIWQTMPGPYAVATAYGQKNPTILGGGERNVLVFDLGAGTFNTALASIEQGIIEMKAIASDTHLGGEDFVNRLVSERVNMIKEMWKKDITVNRRALRRLRTACETAIHELSSASEAHISIDSLYEGRDLHSTISRARFEEVCQDLFRSIIYPIDRVLHDAKMDKSEVHDILLVGGSSRVPRVQKILSSYFNGKDLTKTMNPDEGEVSGLAIKAAMCAGGTCHQNLLDLLVIEAIPISIGIEVTGGLMTKLIPRNTTIPTVKSEILLLDGNTRFLFVYEGERQRTKHNKVLAKVDLQALCLFESQEKVQVECTIKVDHRFSGLCILTEKARGNSITVSLNLRGHLPDEELKRIAADAVQYKMIDDAEAKRVRIRDGLDSRIAYLLESLSDLAPSALVGSLLKTTNEIRDWADDSLLADISEYRLKDQKLDEIENAMVLTQRQLSEREALAERLQQVRQKLHSSTPTPVVASILGEANGIHAWLENFALAQPSEYSERLERLGDILAQLDVVTKPSGNSNDAGKTEPTSADDHYGKKAKESSQTATRGMESDESIVSRKADSSSLQPRVQSVPENETLESLFSRFRGTTRESFTDAQFERISTFLQNSGQAAWSKIPRLYTVLRLIDQLDAMESFVAQSITDIWFPFTTSTLPSTLQPSIQSSFLEVQPVVLSKGFRLEKGADREHALFSQDEPLPFQVIGRLGRGAHGSVDKIMSTISNREYARKIFKKTRGLKREDIKTFITELTVLKRVHHRHCVELLGSYSDPRNFALIMEPVGDHNLAEYYHKAKDNSDMLSLMRSFFGCLVNAMQYLHGVKIRHRDIKPQNIIVKGERVLLTDFGIAYNWENLTRGTTTADSGKTLAYAAPEVARVEARNDSADIWSLGCVFLEMATVLKRKTVGDMRDCFRKQSDSYCFHVNSDGIAAWISQLRDAPPATDNVALDWAANMLQPTASKRPTAATLFEDIVAECDRCGILFCGPCCQDADSTTGDEDDSHLWGKDDVDSE